MTQPPPARNLRLKRAYEAPSPDDGERILVERLWPRGVRKEALQLADWDKDIAPSTELRKWYGHEPARWDEFRQRYAAELRQQPERLQALRTRARAGVVTLIYSSHTETQNNAVALRDFLLHPELLSG